ncbi:H-NS histone family protein [Roseitranquillus sediminis]|uniref:H-NS histone family protein n=1 Tax=Roseitranquillus sediminis TaxID=2809051 RepID=UPI001D0C5924|nr:H-NS histone family protein [Roseitranquillus sediminis]MBM9594529.1 H-NS histone family protein [Roseitranquillus sediminis]
MAVDYEKMSYDELQRHQKELKRAMSSYEERRKKEALIEMQEVARRHGVDLNEIVRGGKKGTASVPKYRHPENPDLTWAGRGRQPRWVKEMLEDGKSLEELRI